MCFSPLFTWPLRDRFFFFVILRAQYSPRPLTAQSFFSSCFSCFAPQIIHSLPRFAGTWRFAHRFFPQAQRGSFFSWVFAPNLFPGSRAAVFSWWTKGTFFVPSNSLGVTHSLEFVKTVFIFFIYMTRKNKNSRFFELLFFFSQQEFKAPHSLSWEVCFFFTVAEIKEAFLHTHPIYRQKRQNIN